jgi:hypothetical protein
MGCDRLVYQVIILALMASGGIGLGQTPTQNPPSVAFRSQPLTDASGECKACHPRQYFEMKQAVHFGYRNVSPVFNGLEVAGNFFTGGLLRPVYGDSGKKLSNGEPLNTNNLSTPVFKDVLQADAGFCYTCHQALIERKGEDPSQRTVPEIATGLGFRPDLLRPLRDYNILDSNGNQVLPADPGGPVPTDETTCGVDGGCIGDPLSTTGITCDSCHDVAGPDLNRSFQHDGFANMSLLLNTSIEKVAQLPFAVPVNQDFHVASTDVAKINYLNNSAFCNACHDVRVPRAAPGDLQHAEANVNPGGGSVSYFRLENLGSEWQTGPFNTNGNPFGKVVVCQDCHTSLFPFNGTSTYAVGDMTVTAATPGIFPSNYAAQPNIPFNCNGSDGRPLGVFCDPPSVGTAAAFDNNGLTTTIRNSVDGGYPLAKRPVSTHYFTGVDVPLMGWQELTTRLGPDYSDPLSGSTGINDDGTPGGTDVDPGGVICSTDQPCLNEDGVPRSMELRREQFLRNAVRISLGKTDTSASLGGTFTVRAEAVALTGHRFPAGLSQERTAYIQLNVTDDNGFVLYQSGYVTDKPHPQTGESDPDGNLDDEDLEHIHVVADPGRHTDVYQPGPATNGHTNQVIEAGPDSGPEDRVYSGVDTGLVLFRNELQKIFLPGEAIGRNDADGNPIIARTPHLEETLSADLANTVDNYRSLQPLAPRTFKYVITLPTQQELVAMGVLIKGPLHVHAQVNYEHFPPMTLRFVARTTSAEGPAGHDMNLLNEQTIDSFLRNIQNLASDDLTVQIRE